MILDKIVEDKKKDLKNRFNECHKIYKRIKEKEDLFVLGEIKKASPSAGVIQPDFDIQRYIELYEHSKVDGISILTEKNYFQGEIEYLDIAKKISHKPILRKDFIIDAREIIEAKVHGANLILLIVAILDKEKLKQFYQLAHMLDLECIVEVHDEKELQIALELDVDIIGINNRNLYTFEVDLKTTERLMKHIPFTKAVISESGIHTKEDIEYLKSLGINGVLIGESFMKSTSIDEHYRKLGLADVT